MRADDDLEILHADADETAQLLGVPGLVEGCNHARPATTTTTVRVVTPPEHQSLLRRVNDSTESARRALGSPCAAAALVNPSPFSTSRRASWHRTDSDDQQDGGPAAGTRSPMGAWSSLLAALRAGGFVTSPTPRARCSPCPRGGGHGSHAAGAPLPRTAQPPAAPSPPPRWSSTLRAACAALATAAGVFAIAVLVDATLLGYSRGNERSEACGPVARRDHRRHAGVSSSSSSNGTTATTRRRHTWRAPLRDLYDDDNTRVEQRLLRIASGSSSSSPAGNATARRGPPPKKGDKTKKPSATTTTTVPADDHAAVVVGGPQLPHHHDKKPAGGPPHHQSEEEDDDVGDGPGARPRQSDLRFWGSHNSYHRAPRTLAFPFVGAWIPAWRYTHAGLVAQLEAGARHLELDVHADVARRTAAVYHVPSLDPRTRCFCLVSCVRDMLAWSRRRGRRHALVVILIEPKGARSALEDARSHARGFGTDRAATRTVLELLDDALFAAFDGSDDDDDRAALLTPRDLLASDDAANATTPRDDGDDDSDDDVDQAPVRGSLAATIARRGWPAARALRGKFAFALLDSTRANLLNAAYASRSRAALAARAMFAMSTDPRAAHEADAAPPNAVNGDADVAVLKLDNPAAHLAAIQAAVRRGFLVRTRADTMRRPHDAARYALAERSGAQLVSFEADAAANWARFVATVRRTASRGESSLRRGSDHERRPVCLCNRVALETTTTTWSGGRRRTCRDEAPPCE